MSTTDDVYVLEIALYCAFYKLRQILRKKFFNKKVNQVRPGLEIFKISQLFVNFVEMCDRQSDKLMKLVLSMVFYRFNGVLSSQDVVVKFNP